MRKLALRDEILLQIDKAARYIGGEVNAVMKNKEDVDHQRIILCTFFCKKWDSNEIQ